MEIGIVIEKNYPLDREVRTRRLARTLDEAGYSTTIYAHNSRSDPARGTIQDELSPPVERLSYALVRRFSWLASIPSLSAITRPFPFNPVWIVWLLLRFARDDIDLVVACDVRAGPTAIVAAKLLGIPVVVDVRENFTEFAKVLSPESTVGRIAYNPRVVSALERFIFRAADEVWVVTPERTRALPGPLRERADLTVVKNVPVLGAAADDDGEFDGIDRRVGSGFTFVYVGVINDFRGLDRIVEALAHVPDDEEVHVVIGGEGPHRESLERLAARLGVDESVTFTGWVDADAVPARLGAGDVGLIPHEVNGFTNTTLPNKLFDCMRQGLPVLVSDMAPVARIVTETGCGRVVPADADSRRVAEVMLEMKAMGGTGALAEMGESGRQAVQADYNWGVESERVLDSIGALTRRAG